MWDDGFSVKQATKGPEGSIAKVFEVLTRDPNWVGSENRVRIKIDEYQLFLAAVPVFSKRHFVVTAQLSSIQFF